MKCDYSQNDLFDQLGGLCFPVPHPQFFTIHDSQTIAEARSLHNREPVVVLLHPDLGEHPLDELLVRLGTTLAQLFSLFLPPSTNLIPSYPSQMTGTTGTTRKSNIFFLTHVRWE